MSGNVPAVLEGVVLNAERIWRSLEHVARGDLEKRGRERRSCRVGETVAQSWRGELAAGGGGGRTEDEAEEEAMGRGLGVVEEDGVAFFVVDDEEVDLETGAEIGRAGMATTGICFLVFSVAIREELPLAAIVEGFKAPLRPLIKAGATVNMEGSTERGATPISCGFIVAIRFRCS